MLRLLDLVMQSFVYAGRVKSEYQRERPLCASTCQITTWSLSRIHQRLMLMPSLRLSVHIMTPILIAGVLSVWEYLPATRKIVSLGAFMLLLHVAGCISMELRLWRLLAIRDLAVGF